MSITLSIPPAVVHEARAFAESQGTSLNAMIRDFLSHVATGDLRRREAANSFREVAAMVRKRRKAGSGYRFNRADAYDRGGRRMTFLDSNIAVYAVDSHDPRKQEIAARLIDEAVGGEGYRISAQVFFEFANICQKELDCEPQEVLKLLNLLCCIGVVDQTPQIVSRAVEIKALYGISLQDAMIVAAAEKSGCDKLLSEDLNDGQIYAGVRVVNPFKSKP